MAGRRRERTPGLPIFHTIFLMSSVTKGKEFMPMRKRICVRMSSPKGFVTQVECDSGLHHDVFGTCIQAIGKSDDSRSTDRQACSDFDLLVRRRIVLPAYPKKPVPSVSFFYFDIRKKCTISVFFSVQSMAGNSLTIGSSLCTRRMLGRSVNPVGMNLL